MNLRNLARGRQCTIRLPGICCGDPDTTVLAHYRLIGISGMGLKSPDLFGAWACSACHDACDARTHKDLDRDYRDLALLQGVIRTQAILLSEGHIKC
jgi:hypothetical protein